MSSNDSPIRTAQFPDYQQSEWPDSSTLSSPSDGSYWVDEPYMAIVPSTPPKAYPELIEEQSRAYQCHAEVMLHEVVDSIEHLLPLVVDAETQQLLDLAINRQEIGPSDDLQEWASQLADDVKDAND